jgi:hypothetical protein
LKRLVCSGSSSSQCRLGWLSAIFGLVGWVLWVSSSLAQVPNPAAILPGNLSLDLSKVANSSLGIDLGYLEGLLCNKGGTGQCGLNVDKVAANPALVLTVTKVRPSSDQGADVSVVPASFSLAGSDLNTSCGLWRYQISLDPQIGQSGSLLHLSPPASNGDATAPFSGTVSLAAVLRFESLEASDPMVPAPTVVVLPEMLTLELAGRWTTVIAAPFPKGKSNLVLMAENTAGIWGCLAHSRYGRRPRARDSLWPSDLVRILEDRRRRLEQPQIDSGPHGAACRRQPANRAKEKLRPSSWRIVTSTDLPSRVYGKDPTTPNTA